MLGKERGAQSQMTYPCLFMYACRPDRVISNPLSSIAVLSFTHGDGSIPMWILGAMLGARSDPERAAVDGKSQTCACSTTRLLS